jgi:2-dehydro-3-deoxygluconokinase
MSTIVTFGEIMARVEAEHGYRFRQALPGQVKVTFAGAEANVAASLAMMGEQTQFVTSLPANPLTDACIASLKSTDVGVDHIRITDTGRLGLYFLETGANQRPSNVIYDRDYTSISMADPASYDWDTIFTDAAWFHISGITPAISRQSAQAALESVKKAKEHGVQVSCDLNYRKKLWNWDSECTKKDLARRTMRELLHYVDVVIGNEEDAADVLDIHPKDVDVHAGSLQADSYISVAQEVKRQFPNVRLISFTLRESISASHNNWGAMIYDTATTKAFFAPQQDGVYKPYEIRNIVDRVGGGDSFSAGLIYALLDEQLSAPEQAVAYAAAASCLCHSIHGDMNYSSTEEILRLMHGNSSGRVVR